MVDKETIMLDGRSIKIRSFAGWGGNEKMSIIVSRSGSWPKKNMVHDPN